MLEEKWTYNDIRMDCHEFEDITHLDARFKRLIWGIGTDGFEEAIWMVLWQLREI
jgi:hypothetical protein